MCVLVSEPDNLGAGPENMRFENLEKNQLNSLLGGELPYAPLLADSQHRHLSGVRSAE